MGSIDAKLMETIIESESNAEEVVTLKYFNDHVVGLKRTETRGGKKALKVYFDEGVKAQVIVDKLSRAEIFGLLDGLLYTIYKIAEGRFDEET